MVTAQQNRIATETQIRQAHCKRRHGEIQERVIARNIAFFRNSDLVNMRL